MRSIHIHMTRRESGSVSFTVREGDAFADELCFDEMLGQVVSLCHPQLGEARYDMRTADQWAAIERVREAQRLLREAECARDSVFGKARS